MASELYWFYDVFALGLGLVYLYVGARRGFVRSVVLVILTVISIILSWFASTVFAPMVYENVVKEPLMERIDGRLEKKEPVKTVSDAVNGGQYGVEMTGDEVGGILSLGGDFFKNIASALKENGAGDSGENIENEVKSSVTEEVVTIIVGDRVSPEVLKEILSTVSDAEKSLHSVVNTFVGGSRADTAAAIESQVVAPVVIMVLKGIIWIIAMAVLMAISRAVANAMKGLNKIPVIGPVNSLFGAALGLAEGVIVLYIISQLVKLVCYMTSNSLMFLNSDTVAETRIFKEFYNFIIK